MCLKTVRSIVLNDKEILSGFELNSWLNSLQNKINNKVFFIYDSCGSGSFINSLKSSFGNNRIVITSCSESESAIFASNGTMSFSYFFWSNIFGGLNIAESFINASNSLSLSVRSQNPLIDANSNGIYNEKEDIKIVKDIFLNK